MTCENLSGACRPLQIPGQARTICNAQLTASFTLQEPRMISTPRFLLSVIPLLFMPAISQAQFKDPFDGPGIEGWFQQTGDGTPTMEVEQKEGFARIKVDGSKDRYGIWWTFIKRDITSSLDLQKLRDPAYELRVEARVRASHAPRRVNFMVNTQRTTNFHEHLREFDIADTTEWHTISMTTKDFDVVPGDTVFVQFCVTDWGPDQYYVDVDYYRADVVRRNQAGPDKGEPLVYHPPVPELKTFTHHLGVTHDSVINSDFPEVNFNDWHAEERDGTARVLTVDANQWIVLRWDLEKFRGLKADGAGLLELTTSSLPNGGKYIEAFGKDLGEEFGKIQVIEILGGDPAWTQENVTYNSLLQGGAYGDVFNTQMTIALELAEKPGEKAYFTFPRPVMQRLLDGTTKGILIRPLGALAGSIYASESKGNNGPKLHFRTTP
jgi:hypothetical protein